MKKLLKAFLVIALFVATGLGVACKKAPKVDSIYVDLGQQTSISVKHKDTNWDPADILVVKAVLSDKTEKTLNAEDCSFEGVNVNNVGEQTLTVSYGAYETTVPVVVYKYATAIGVVSGSIPTTVNHNGTLNLENAKINVTYSDGSMDYNVTEGFEISTPNTSTVGEKELTVTYGDVSCTFDYEVQKTVVNMVVSGYEHNVKYGTSYNYEGVKIEVTYSDETVDTLIAGEYQVIKSINVNEKNAQDYFTVSYTYNGVSYTKNSSAVNVFVVLESLEYVSGIPATIEYDVDLNLNDVVVKGVYTDGSKVELDLNPNNFNFTLNKINQANDIVISYTEGVNTRFVTVQTTVYKEFKNAIKATTTVSDATDLVVGEKDFDKADFRFYEIWSGDDELTNVEINADLITYVYEDKNTDGTYDNVKISYTKNTTVYTYDIPATFYASVELIPEVTVASVQVKEGFETTVAHNAEYNKNSVVVVVTYSNGVVIEYGYQNNSEDISVAIDTSVVGNATLTVTYKEEQPVTKAVNVQRTITGIAVKSGTALTDVLWGELDLSGVQFVVTYSNGTEEIGISSVNYEQFVMPSASEYAGASSHSLQKSITFVYNPTGCYENTQVSCEMKFNVYEQEVKLVQENADTELNYSTEGVYDLDVIDVYISYTSGNKVEVTNRLTMDPLTGVLEGSESGYHIVNTIDPSVVGLQPLFINYYTYDSTEEEFTLKYSLIVNVRVNDVITSYEVVVSPETIKVNGTFSVSLKPIYKSGAIASIGDYITSGFETSSVDTSTAGVKDVVVTYGGNQYTGKVTVAQSLDTYTVIGFTNPTSIENWKKQSQNKNTYTATGSTGNKGFNDIGNAYLVGDDNGFKFSPVLKVKYDNNETLVGTISDYTLNALVYYYNAYDEEVLADETYYNFDGTTHTFYFEENARGKFKIVVWPNEETSRTIEFVVEVVDGYNVYNAKDLAYLDNSNLENKWENFLGEAYDQTKANDISGIILHNNITVTEADIPDIHFFKESEVNKTDADYDRVVGSLKDSYDATYRHIYQRNVEDGKTFNFEGNYFTIDASQIPLMVRAANDTATGQINANGEAITVHTAILAFRNKDSQGDVNKDGNFEEMGQVNVNNISWFGNSKKSENTALSGGILGLKMISVHSSVYNNLSQAFYIPYFFDSGEDIGYSCNFELKRSNAYDAYNTILYVWGVKNAYIDSCNLIGAGGPVMICDHVKNDETTGAGGYPTWVYVDTRLSDLEYTDKSNLESWVAGTEGWFQTYTGSGALASQIKTFSKLYENDTMKKTLLSQDGTKINLISVHKSGSVEGLSTSTIRGGIVYGDATHSLKLTDNDNLMYIAKQVGLYDAALYLAQDQIAALMGQGMSQEQAIAAVTSSEEFISQVTGYVKQYGSSGVFMVTDSGSVGFPGLDPQVNDGWYIDSATNFNGKPNSTLVNSAESKIYVYLPNGMAASLGVYDYPYAE